MNESSIKMAGELDRRQFLKLTGGFLLAVTLDGATNRSIAQAASPTTVATYLRIGADESITILIGGGEMGQGIYTGLAMAAAEELKVDWANVQVQPVDASISWLSAGSGGIRTRLPTFLKAGAAAREMLISAAAAQWGVNRTLCVAANGRVTNTGTGDTLTYGQLAPAAALLPVPAAPPLTPASQYQIIGTPAQRVDLPPKTNGSAKYGVDTFLPNMLFASVKHSPVMGGFLNSTPTKPSGSIALVPLLPLVNGVLGTVPNAVGVVGTNTFQAIGYANSVSATKWTAPTNANLMDNTVQLAQAKQLLGRGAPYIAEKVGDVDAGLASAVRPIVDSTYTFPYLAHCCMEVLSCTVRLTATTCEIWAPTQGPNSALTTAATVSGLPKTSITIHPTLMGGGLGRKIETDFISQAIQIAKGLPAAYAGRPVKLIWSREQDMANDQYRPMAMIRIQAGLDAAGNVTAWKYRHVSPSITAQRGRAIAATGDSQATEGGTALPYVFGSRLTDYVVHPSPVPVGYWRSVGYSLNTFAVESMMDELALAAGMDPLDFRVQLLQNSTDPLAARTLACLTDAAANAGYIPGTTATTAFGIAVSTAFNTIVAECVKISATATSIKVLSVACTVDCGTAVNPDSVEAQMQGGIFHGLSAALWGQVKWTAGKPGASNFNNYRVLRMNEAPNITVNIINSGAPMSGCGEPGVPTIGPAVANAYAKITGTRVRTLPFFPGATMDGI